MHSWPGRSTTRDTLERAIDLVICLPEQLSSQVKRGVISIAASMAVNPEDQVEAGEEDEENEDEGSVRHHTDVQ